MFDNKIRRTPFNTSFANTACGHIDGEPWANDNTFVSTMRALLFNRMPKESRITFSTYSYNYAKSVIDTNDARNVFNAVVPKIEDDTIKLIVFNNVGLDSVVNNNAFLDFIEANIEKRYPVKRIEKITSYFKKTFRCLCYVSTEHRQCFIFTESIDLRMYHYLQVGILAFLPWYFDKESGTTEKEIALLESLRMKRSDRYMECLADIARECDFRSEYTQRSLKGIETRVERQEIEALTSRISDSELTIEELQNRITSKLSEIRDYNIRIMGLRAKIAHDEENGIESEILNYFMKHKNRLFLEYADDNEIRFVAKDYLMFWDKDIARKLFDNSTSVAYNCGNEIRGPYTKEEMKELFEEIFIRKNFRIKVCGAYDFNIANMRVSAPSGYAYSYEFDDCLPNPHLDRYGCLGSYQSAITEFMKNSDYIGAIEQCIASCRSLNFADGPVMNALFRSWYKIEGSANVRCIELPNGEIVDPAGAIKYMREQKGEENGESN